MNSDNPEHDDFARQLAEFSPTPLPEAWKSELIDNAVSAPPSNVKTVAFSLFQKISLSGIAAASVEAEWLWSQGVPPGIMNVHPQRNVATW